MPRKGQSFASLVSGDLGRFHVMMRGQHVARPMWRKWTDMFSPRFLPILLIRVAGHFYAIRLRPLAKLVSFLNFLFFGIECAMRCRIGPGLFLPHTQGTVIGAAEIGANVTVFQSVTIGAREFEPLYDDEKRPSIGNNVLIGSGAKLLGPIRVGDGARIGANTVVMQDVPDKALVIGPKPQMLEYDEQ